MLVGNPIIKKRSLEVENIKIKYQSLINTLKRVFQ